MAYSFVDMGLYFFLYSCFGWLFESAYCSLEAMTFINRGFLNGPVCPIYGVGALLMFIFLIPIQKKISNPLVALPTIFMSGAVLATVIEYITSIAMEWLFDARWWDYSSFRYNIDGRVCLFVSLVWGGFALLFVYIIQPQFEKIVAVLHRRQRLPQIVLAVCCVLLAVDLVLSSHLAADIGNKLDYIHATLRLW